MANVFQNVSNEDLWGVFKMKASGLLPIMLTGTCKICTVFESAGHPHLVQKIWAPISRVWPPVLKFNQENPETAIHPDKHTPAYRSIGVSHVQFGEHACSPNIQQELVSHCFWNCASTQFGAEPSQPENGFAMILSTFPEQSLEHDPEQLLSFFTRNSSPTYDWQKLMMCQSDADTQRSIAKGRAKKQVAFGQVGWQH